MTPPIHIKIVSGITSALWLALGLRNVFAPGSALPALPKDDKLQLWYWNAGPSALTTGQVR